MSKFSCVVIGNESLLAQCAQILLDRGHAIRAVVTRNSDVAAWAERHGLRRERPGADLAVRLAGTAFDWLFSIANLDLLPDAVVSLAAKGAVNFHDGPLPRYAGLNAPVWALLNRETSHGVAWHMMTGGVDEGDVLERRMFEISPNDTALTLNTKCYAAAIEGFVDLCGALEAGPPTRLPQDLTQRTHFGRNARPPAAARLDFRRDGEDLVALVRALDHGNYWNPLALAKIEAGGRIVLVRAAAQVDRPGGAAPGTVLENGVEGLVVATGSRPIRLGGLTDAQGRPLAPDALGAVGEALPSLDPEGAEALSAMMAAVAPQDAYWRARLRELAPADLPQARASSLPAVFSSLAVERPAGLTEDRLPAVVAAWTARVCGRWAFDLAYCDDALAAACAAAQGCLSPWAPVRFAAPAPEAAFAAAADAFAAELAAARARGPFAADLPARDPALADLRAPQIGIALGQAAGPIAGTCVTVASGDALFLHFDTTRLSMAAAERLAASFGALLQEVTAPGGEATPVDRLPAVGPAERDLTLRAWNDTATSHDRAHCAHQQIEAQAARTPEAIALSFEGVELSYAALDARANRVARVLRSLGVGPDVLVGLHVPRSLDLVVAALAIQKAGGAYVPLDPAYPAERIALYIEDSAAPVIVSRSDIAGDLPPHAARTLEIDTDPRIDAASSLPVDSGVGPENLAYVIFTSGSTGRPKGVMIEHRNLANFFAGMDARLGAEPGVWLAVTSLSFDISVLELFWTLARGFKVVLSSDEDRKLVSSGRLRIPGRPIDFSLFYWGNDDGVGSGKYELLLEGARFADRNGFCAVWTPERHFHAFGGPYPNPSVTGAAVAAVTRNLSVRAGSCVAPLHHTARIAEEWAVIDNLTDGRAALAIASGWQPDDFVLRPENAPPDNKRAMMEAIDRLRRLWRGEAVEFPTRDGTPFAIVTQPRPVSRELPIWVTTAGNPETWREAGSIGANVLTHLLGQSVEEVADKIVTYHGALRAAGHDPADHKVTLMLHSFVGADRDRARETARAPMKGYLRSAAALIKQYAWAFPAFKKPSGVSDPMQIDLQSLSEAELDAILDFAFQRYFEDSGLFGTVEDCLARVERLRRIGVDEIACLIDYGIPTPQVLAGLVPLAEVLKRANAPTEVESDDFSIAAQILRHGVTHLQCTPSMARMLVLNDDTRHALGGIRRLLLGGEPLSGGLVAECGRVTRARIDNMYGPTETTIWSSTAPAEAVEGVVDIGAPIANTQFYVLDAGQAPAPIGAPGELWIGGEGVARGYLGRADLTDERFRPDPFAAPDPLAPAPRMYRTGDLVRRREDGRLDFLGRVDHQVKIRGHRIELGEIEACLEGMPGVRQAVVLAREDMPGDPRLVAYVTGADGLAEQDLRDRLAALLPEHMTPTRILAVDAFPLTPNKKVDRKALPAPAARVDPAGAAAAAPPTEGLEATIGAIWSRVLGVAQVRASDNFFALGGHSLLAVQAQREIAAALGHTRVTITDIFRFPTLAALAAHLDDRPKPPRAADPGAADQAGRAQARTEAMSRRRELRAGFSGRSG